MKYIKILITIFLIVMLCGCCKFDINMKINKEGNITLTTEFLLDEKVFENKLEKTQWIVNNYREDDFYVENLNKDGYIGYLISKAFNIDDYSDSDYVKYNLTDDIYPIDVMFQKNNNKYKAHFIFESDPFVESYAEEYTNYVDANNYRETGKITYTVELPYPAISNNATKVENNGKKLTWVFYEDLDDIEFEFSLDENQTISSNNNNIALIISIVTIIIIVIISLIIVVKRKNKKIKNKQAIKEVSVNLE